MPSVASLRRELANLKAGFDRLSGPRVERLQSYRADPAQLMVDAGLVPDAWQSEFLRTDIHQALLLCARQVGKSTVTAFLALKEALLNPGSTTLIISPTLRQSGELLRKVTLGLNAIGRPVGVTSDAASQLALANGSRVLSLPGSETTVRGLTASLLIVDEAARVVDALLASIRPMLAATGGRFVALSSAFAKSGWFYDLWTGRAERWKRVSVTAYDCPRISKQFLEEERKILGDRWFAMEYLNIFGDDIAAVFSSEDIQAALTDEVQPLFATMGH
jgi:hypothetical protein